jgi:hypothetical protein
VTEEETANHRDSENTERREKRRRKNRERAEGNETEDETHLFFLCVL